MKTIDGTVQRIAVMLLSASAMLGGGAAVSSCGRVGYLEQPAPLFGERAKEEYRAQRAAQTEAQRHRAQARRTPGEVERQSIDPSATDAATTTDNAPVTTRDIQDPAQKLTPLSASPLDGIPSDPRGAQPSLTPPN